LRDSYFGNETKNWKAIKEIKGDLLVTVTLRPSENKAYWLNYSIEEEIKQELIRR